MANNLEQVILGLQKDICKQGGDFEVCRDFMHTDPQTARAEAMQQAASVLLERLRLQKGLHLQKDDLQVGVRAIVHLRQLSDSRRNAYQWRHSSIGNLPAAPTYLGYVFWLPKVAPNPGAGRSGGLGEEAKEARSRVTSEWNAKQMPQRLRR